MKERINLILAHIHQGLLSWIPTHSTDMAEVIDHWFLQNTLPEIALPIGACKAAGGNPAEDQHLRVLTALLAEIISLDILDDYRKKDNSQALWLKLGAERAMHYSHMLHLLYAQLCSQLSEDFVIAKVILNKFQHALSAVLAARNRMDRKEIPTWENYWKYTEMATGYFTGALSAAGAELAAPEGTYIIEACQQFGYHLGLARHFINELEHFSEHRSQYPGHRNVHLAVLYGLYCEHSNQMELKQIVWKEHLEIQNRRVKEILDSINTRDYLIWAALKEKESATEMIGRCPDKEGKEFLKAFMMEWFNRIPVFEQLESGSGAESFKLDIPLIDLNQNPEFTGTPALAYQSIGLGIRKNIRNKPLQINY